MEDVLWKNDESQLAQHSMRPFKSTPRFVWVGRWHDVPLVSNVGNCYGSKKPVIG
jgi:hypothetical protein